MSRFDEPDDSDALSFGDEDDPTHVAHATAESASDATRPATADAPATSSALLVVYGIFGGVYLLFLVGWIVAAQRDTFSIANVFFEIMRQFGTFLSIASPALWFVTVFALTRHSAAARLLWLLLGVVVVAPWPFVFPGSAS